MFLLSNNIGIKILNEAFLKEINYQNETDYFTDISIIKRI